MHAVFLVAYLPHWLIEFVLGCLWLIHFINALADFVNVIEVIVVVGVVLFIVLSIVLRHAARATTDWLISREDGTWRRTRKRR